MSEQTSGERVRFVVDPALCRTCGSAAEGLRCGQRVTPGYERELVRSRMVQGGATAQPLSGTAPCRDLCPLSLCIQGYSKHIAAGEYTEALGHIMVRTVLPHSVCRVCDRPCESACVRSQIDEPVAINELKRFVLEWADAQEEFPWTPPQEARHEKRVAVIGAGPSGLSAAHDLALRGYSVTAFDSADRPGGLLAHGIPAYRLPQEMVEMDVERVAKLGVDFVMSTALGRDITLGGLLEDGYDAVYLAFGAHRSRALGLEGEGAAKSPTLVPALAYLRAARESEAAGEPGNVVVIGGGDAAVDAARTALRSGAKSVTLACLETREHMPALPDQIAAAEEEGIVISTAVRPLRLAPSAIVFEALGGDAPGSAGALPADLVIVAIGQVPALDALAEDPVRLTFTDDGHLEVDPQTHRTSDARIFAGGDAVPGPRTVTSAIADGLRASWAIDAALRSHEEADLRAPPPRPGLRRESPVPTTPAAPRQSGPALPLAERLQGFAEVSGTLSEDDARAEARRCMVCGLCGNCRSCLDLFGCPALGETAGVISIDPSLCNGCGVCVSFCPNQAIVPEVAS